MAEPRFKVGDRVRMVWDGMPARCGTVERLMQSPSAVPIWSILLDGEATATPWYEDVLEPLPPTPEDDPMPLSDAQLEMLGKMIGDRLAEGPHPPAQTGAPASAAEPWPPTPTMSQEAIHRAIQRGLHGKSEEEPAADDREPFLLRTHNFRILLTLMLDAGVSPDVAAHRAADVVLG